MTMRTHGLLLLLTGTLTAGASGDALAGGTSSVSSPILDDMSEPLYEMGVAYIPEQNFESYGDSAVLEIDANWEVAYFRDILMGDIELDVRIESDIFMDSTRLQLPNQVAVLAMDTAWTCRRADGTALRLGLMPGVYSDLEEIDGNVLYMPFSFALIRSFTPDLAGIAGFDARLGFDRVFMPIIGLTWNPADRIKVKAQLPESRVQVYLNRAWSTELGLAWQNMSYSLREKGDYNRDQITLQDLRFYWGLTHRMLDDVQVSLQVGSVFGRQVDFDEAVEGVEEDVEPDNAYFLRVALGGVF